MILNKLEARVRELAEVNIASKSPTLRNEFEALKRKANAAGRLRSGATIKQLYRATTSDLGARAEIILDAVRRTYEAHLPASKRASREQCKTLAAAILEEHTASVMRHLDDALSSLFDQSTLGRIGDTVSVPTDLIGRKLAVELDLYFDHFDAEN